MATDPDRGSSSWEGVRAARSGVAAGCWARISGGGPGDESASRAVEASGGLSVAGVAFDVLGVCRAGAESLSEATGRGFALAGAGRAGSAATRIDMGSASRLGSVTDSRPDRRSMPNITIRCTRATTIAMRPRRPRGGRVRR